MNVHTHVHPDDEIRGQLEASDEKNATTSATQSNTDTGTNTQAESAIVTPTGQ
jgi:hypothetical protein